MNNSEKAIEIATRKGIYTKSVSQGDIINAALIMAEWKDQQFKEYLEKKLDGATEKAYSSHTFDIGAIIEKGVYKKIINELFPKEEIEDNTERED